MKLLSIYKEVSPSKNIIVALAAATLYVAQSTDAAVITLTDDGVDTTIAWTGSFDSFGLIEFDSQRQDFFGAEAPMFFSEQNIATSEDIALFNGSTGPDITLYAIFEVIESAGWLDPVGDTMTFVSSPSGRAGATFFLNSENFTAGFISTFDGYVILGGTLTENGFAPNESITFNNPNVSGDSGQIVMQTFVTPVPEPSSALLLGMGSVALLLRRKK